jgi:hypothetical protein
LGQKSDEKTHQQIRGIFAFGLLAAVKATKNTFHLVEGREAREVKEADMVKNFG